jgi:hypothetical protein
MNKFTLVYRKTKKVIIAAGAQQIDKGIQRGLVKIINIKTQKASPKSIKMTLDCRKISNWKIIENRVNFSKNFNRDLNLFRILVMMK